MMAERSRSLQWQGSDAAGIAVITEEVVMVTRGVRRRLRSPLCREQGSETVVERGEEGRASEGAERGKGKGLGEGWRRVAFSWEVCT